MTTLKIHPPPSPNREKFPFVCSVFYKKMWIDIENMDGGVREGTDSKGKHWKTIFKGVHYGELRKSLGSDGDKLDIYIKANPSDSGSVFIVHQNFPGNHPTKAGKYDEDKCMVAFGSAKEAKEAYLRHYNRKDFFRSITEMPISKFMKYALGENKGEKVAHWSEGS